MSARWNTDLPTVGVSEETAEVKELGKKDLAPVHPKDWQVLLGLISQGVKVDDALVKAGVRRFQLEGAIRFSPKYFKQYEDAKLAALRSRYSLETIEQVMEDIATDQCEGNLAAILERNFLDVAGFYRLLHRDPVVREMYDEARIIQSELLLDEMRRIADDSSDDWTEDGRGNPKVNNEAVQRSRVRIDHLKWRLAKLNRKRFGEKTEIEHSGTVTVNHEAKLVAARKRAEGHLITQDEEQEG